MKHYLALLIAFLLLVLGCAPPGQRLVTIQVEKNGAVVLEGRLGLPDSVPVEHMWDAVHLASFKAAPGANAKLLAGGAAKAATIDGAEVRILHAGDELDARTIKKLSLQSDDSGSTWSLSESQFKKAKTGPAK